MAVSNQEPTHSGRRRPIDSATAKLKVAIADVAARCVQEPGSKRACAIVTIRTESGVTGVGETAACPDPKTAVAMILAQRKNLVGQDATAAELVRKSLSAQTRRHELAPLQAAVNMALLDILGNLSKAPLMPGARREPMPARKAARLNSLVPKGVFLRSFSGRRCPPVRLRAS